jgi:hypothetical protein
VYNHDIFNLTNGVFVVSGTGWFDEIKSTGKESLSGCFLLNQNYRVIINPAATLSNCTIRIAYWFRAIGTLDLNTGIYSESIQADNGY